MQRKRNLQRPIPTIILIFGKKSIFCSNKSLTLENWCKTMIELFENTLQKDIESLENPEFWRNFSFVSSRILDLLKVPNPDPENFGVIDPTKVKSSDSLFVSLFLYHISENTLIKNQTLTNLPKTKKQYSISEHKLHYIITVHSEKHTLSINAMEKILGIIYSNPEVLVSDIIKQIHIRFNFKDNPIDIWNRMFPSNPYQLSILLTVSGPGVMYLNPEVREGKGFDFYDSKK